MKGDRELCTASVAQRWVAIAHVSEALKDDENIFVAAICQYLKVHPSKKGNEQETKRMFSGNCGIPEEALIWQNAHLRRAAGL